MDKLSDRIRHDIHSKFTPLDLDCTKTMWWEAADRLDELEAIIASLPTVPKLLMSPCPGGCWKGKIWKKESQLPNAERKCPTCLGEGETPVKCENCDGCGNRGQIPPQDYTVASDEELEANWCDCEGSGYEIERVVAVPGDLVWRVDVCGQPFAQSYCGFITDHLGKIQLILTDSEELFYADIEDCFATEATAKLLGATQ